MRHHALTAIVFVGCSSAAPCDPAFRWESGVTSAGDCELSLSHGSSFVTFDVPQPSSCSVPVVVSCGPLGTTCTRTCSSLSIVGDADASRTIVAKLGTSNPKDVTADLQCGELGHVHADVIIETSGAGLQVCSP